MADTSRDQRLTDASTLREALDSLLHVPAAQRRGFVHDRLMTAVDDICKRHPAGKGGFSPTQINILKDVVYHVVHVLDPLNEQKKGFLPSLKSEWRDMSAMSKIKTVVAVITVTSTAAVGMYHIGRSTYEWYRASALDAAKAAPAAAPSTKPAANFPPGALTPNTFK